VKRRQSQDQVDGNEQTGDPKIMIVSFSLFVNGYPKRGVQDHGRNEDKRDIKSPWAALIPNFFWRKMFEKAINGRTAE